MEALSQAAAVCFEQPSRFQSKRRAGVCRVRQGYLTERLLAPELIPLEVTPDPRAAASAPMNTETTGHTPASE